MLSGQPSHAVTACYARPFTVAGEGAQDVALANLIITAVPPPGHLYPATPYVGDRPPPAPQACPGRGIVCRITRQLWPASIGHAMHGRSGRRV
jgi:hypothetical protein